MKIFLLPRSYALVRVLGNKLISDLYLTLFILMDYSIPIDTISM